MGDRPRPNDLFANRHGTRVRVKQVWRYTLVLHISRNESRGYREECSHDQFREACEALKLRRVA